MARPPRDKAPDLAQSHELTAGLIERVTCRTDRKAQAFLRDSKAPGLRVRVSNTGAKTFVFEAKLNRRTFRRAIGDVRAWSIEDARKVANELRVTLDGGDDPRVLELELQAAKTARDAAAAARAVTVGDVWPLYLAQGKPKRRDAWKPGYRADIEAMGATGGEAKKRGKGLTRPGPIYPLLALALSAINEDTLKSWFDLEAQASRHQAARALMMFRGFMRWCSTKPEYCSMVDRDAGRAAAILEALPQVTKRTDCLEAAQLPGWFAGTDKLNNRTIAIYLKALLLTGARREEMAALKWADVDFQWCRMTLADKVESTRTIPLTPYLAQHLTTLPRRNAFVFASGAKGGRITEPRASHGKVLQDAAIKGLTIHGLRRSFSLLGKAAGAPAGAIAQVMGHKPSATAEGYRPRSVDALRPFLALVEKHILEKAGIEFDADAEPGRLALVSSGIH